MPIHNGNTNGVRLLSPATAELRRAIWKLCLPHRVVELDIPSNGHIDTYCQLWRTSSINSRPPIITRVCCEARQVAFEKGGLTWDVIGVDDGPVWWANNSNLTPWFNPTTDIVHLNWFPPYDLDYVSSGNPISFSGQLPKGGVRLSQPISCMLSTTILKVGASRNSTIFLRAERVVRSV